MVSKILSGALCDFHKLSTDFKEIEDYTITGNSLEIFYFLNNPEIELDIKMLHLNLWHDYLAYTIKQLNGIFNLLEINYAVPDKEYKQFLRIKTNFDKILIKDSTEALREYQSLLPQLKTQYETAHKLYENLNETKTYLIKKGRERYLLKVYSFISGGILLTYIYILHNPVQTFLVPFISKAGEATLMESLASIGILIVIEIIAYFLGLFILSNKRGFFLKKFSPFIKDD